MLKKIAFIFIISLIFIGCQTFDQMNICNNVLYQTNTKTSVRELPETGAAIKEEIDSGSPITLTGKTKFIIDSTFEWINISTANTNGWIYSGNITRINNRKNQNFRYIEDAFLKYINTDIYVGMWSSELISIMPNINKENKELRFCELDLNGITIYTDYNSVSEIVITGPQYKLSNNCSVGKNIRNFLKDGNEYHHFTNNQYSFALINNLRNEALNSLCFINTDNRGVIKSIQVISESTYLQYIKDK